MISAFLISLKVLLNEATKLGGSFRMKPTVSLINILSLASKSRVLVVESKVANNLSSAKTSAEASMLKSVDFPALVYPASAIFI